MPRLNKFFHQAHILQGFIINKRLLKKSPKIQYDSLIVSQILFAKYVMADVKKKKITFDHNCSKVSGQDTKTSRPMLLSLTDFKQFFRAATTM